MELFQLRKKQEIIVRIGPIEIAWSVKRFARVWHRPPLSARHLDYMTPTELRAELSNILREMQNHRSPRIPRGDHIQRIHFFNNER